MYKTDRPVNTLLRVAKRHPSAVGDSIDATLIWDREWMTTVSQGVSQPGLWVGQIRTILSPGNLSASPLAGSLARIYRHAHDCRCIRGGHN